MGAAFAEFRTEKMRNISVLIILIISVDVLPLLAVLCFWYCYNHYNAQLHTNCYIAYSFSLGAAASSTKSILKRLAAGLICAFLCAMLNLPFMMDWVAIIGISFFAGVVALGDHEFIKHWIGNGALGRDILFRAIRGFYAVIVTILSVLWIPIIKSGDTETITQSSGFMLALVYTVIAGMILFDHVANSILRDRYAKYTHQCQDDPAEISNDTIK